MGVDGQLREGCWVLAVRKIPEILGWVLSGSVFYDINNKIIEV
jgi:hypothetical protein